MTTVASLIMATAAFADDVSNNLDTSIDATAEVMNLTAGGLVGTTNLLVTPRNEDGKNGCNLTGSTVLTTSVSSSNTAVATVSPSSVTFDSCGATPTLTVTPLSEGSATISLAQTANTTGGTFNLAPASFTVQVAAATAVDEDPPVINCDVPDSMIWYGANVTVNCTAEDSGSGLADAADASFSLSTSVAAGAEDSAAQTNSRTVFDIDGNSATAGPYTFMVDLKGPTVTCNTPAPSFVLNQAPAVVTATATDAGSGPATQQASANADTSAVGTGRTVVVSALDAVGNSGSASCSYNVVYNFDGLYAPVDRPNIMNVSKAGQAIPLKWRITDFFGAPVTTLPSVTVKAASASCTLGTTADQVEEIASGSSGLQNLGDGYYQFNWKTPTSYANSCKTIGLDLGGSVHANLALFNFKK